MTAATLRMGTRTSRLARWQTDHVAALLRAAWPGLDCEIVPFSTRGDQILDQPLPAIGGKGLFTAELEAALRQGAIDIAVHSLKDLPVEDASGLTIGAIPPRASVQDALVSASRATLDALPPGAVVGTSSVRRCAQLLARRPDLEVRSIRGNVETRLRKVLEDGLYAATVLALAGLERLELADRVTELLAMDCMLPAPGQGALGVQCRRDDAATLARLAALDDPSTRVAVTAERTFLLELGGGCSAPIGAYAQTDASGRLDLQGVAGAPDGSRLIRVHGRGADPTTLAATLAAQALSQGAAELLA